MWSKEGNVGIFLSIFVDLSSLLGPSGPSNVNRLKSTIWGHNGTHFAFRFRVRPLNCHAEEVGQKIQIYFLPLPLPAHSLGLKDVSPPSVQEGSLLILRTIYHQLRPTGTVQHGASE